MFHFRKRKPSADMSMGTPGEMLDETRLLQLCASFGQVMMPQLARAGLEPGRIPPGHLAASLQAGGYIHGICAAIAEDAGHKPDDDYVATLTAWAFVDIYGDAGETLHGMTLRAHTAGEIVVIQGNLMARDDWWIVSRKSSRPGPWAFWRIATGDPFEP